ncbi:MAG: histidine phosphatase family protein [Burkholderiales bacterium]|nr:histidine phosphatase family protein [Burkholderiales bacterium]
MTATSILLIRHGETAWNSVRRLQGHIDIPLNPEGERQAHALGRILAHDDLSAVISSDLQRALQTAQAVVGHHHKLTVQTDPGLRERCYGAFEGLLYSEIMERYPTEYAQWQAREVDTVMPPGERVAESFRQFYQRSIDSIGAWAARHAGQTIVIVAHGGVLECAYRAARGISLDSPRDFQVPNAGINRFTFANGKLSLDSWGDTSHLQAALDDII